jgi:hypothetical protein
MSGWIKLEKDLRTDPRVLRMASQLGVTLDRHGCVTLVLGGLAQIWMLADTHVGNGDILPLGIDDINDIVGIQGFVQLIPQDWLQIVDADNVKLPGFHKHNGTVAKERAQGQKRNARYVKRRDDTPSQGSDAKTSLDLDLDLDLKEKLNKKKIAGRLPDDFFLTQERGDYAKQHGLDPGETYEAFCDYWRAANGANAIKRDWEAAWRTWVRSPYNQPKANGKALQPAQAPTERASAEWSELLSAGRAEGLGEPYKLETPQAYAERLRGYRARQRPKLDTSALVGKLRGLL